jgi:hypothetical protein
MVVADDPADGVFEVTEMTTAARTATTTATLAPRMALVRQHMPPGAVPSFGRSSEVSEGSVTESDTSWAGDTTGAEWLLARYRL